MGNKSQSTPQEASETESVYFELQASWGVTKHMGGLETTIELADLCHIDGDKYVLVVGCGVGITPCYLAERYGCPVVGVDLSEKMITRSGERAKRKGVEDRVEFRVADAQNLPFKDATFDAVICESVLAFVGDKQRAVNEFTRVAKPGGYAGFNEVTWIEPPPAEMVEYMTRIMGAGFLTADGWKALTEGSRLKEMTASTYKTSAWSQWASEVRQFEFWDFLKAWGKYLYLFIKSPACRRFTRESLAFPRSIFSLFRYFGYGIYTGRK
ncbi:class I SAM-dependent methyltransferase [Chloroflexota bacterium]